MVEGVIGEAARRPLGHHRSHPAAYWGCRGTATARAFFEAHFFTKAFVDTKRQIARRIYDFIRNKTFERMFSSPTNKLDMFEAMNSGAIVLVNTSKALLKSAASVRIGATR